METRLTTCRQLFTTNVWYSEREDPLLFNPKDLPIIKTPVYLRGNMYKIKHEIRYRELQLVKRMKEKAKQRTAEKRRASS